MPPSLHDFNVTNDNIENIKDSIWKITNPETQDTFFVKRCTASEIAMTEKASNFDGLPEDSLVELPEFLGRENAIPASLLSQFPVMEDDRTELMVIKGHKMDTGLDVCPGQLSLLKENHALAEQIMDIDENGLPNILQGQKMTANEIENLQLSVRVMNEGGIFNHDLMSNILIERDDNGKMRFCIIDMEPDTFAPIYEGKLEDVGHVRDFGTDLEGAAFVEDNYKARTYEEIMQPKLDKGLSCAFANAHNANTVSQSEPQASHFDVPSPPQQEHTAPIKPS